MRRGPAARIARGGGATPAVPTLLARLASLAVLAFTAFLNTPAPAAEPAPDRRPDDEAVMWQTLILQHLERYPGLEPADLYKLLHQATEGAEHAVSDRASASAWLQRELGSLGAGPTGEEPLIDPLGDAARYVRVHLRPYLRRGGDPDTLLEAFIATANAGSSGFGPSPRGPESSIESGSENTSNSTADSRPDSTSSSTSGPDTTHARLRAAIHALLSMSVDGRLPWPAGTIEAFVRDRAQEGYPAVRHSEFYRETYRPAYRVIAREFVPSLWPRATAPSANPPADATTD